MSEPINLDTMRLEAMDALNMAQETIKKLCVIALSLSEKNKALEAEKAALEPKAEV